MVVGLSLFLSPMFAPPPKVLEFPPPLPPLFPLPRFHGSKEGGERKMWGGGQVTEFWPIRWLLTIVTPLPSSQSNSIYVVHCFVRYKDVFFFLSFFAPSIILWLPYIQGLASVFLPVFREISTLSLFVWVRLMAQGRFQLDPFFASVRLTAQGRFQLDPFFASVRLTAQGRFLLHPFFALVHRMAFREISTLSLFSLGSSSGCLGRFLLYPFLALVHRVAV